MPKVYFVTLPNGYFGSAGQSWLSLDLTKLSQDLKELGFKIHITTIDDVIYNESINIKDIVIYTSSEIESVRQYIKDVMYVLSKKCRLVPSYDLLMAHENKGFQELLRMDRGFGDLHGAYFFDHVKLPENYPYIYKNTNGAGSSGVKLVTSCKVRSNIIKAKERVGLKRKLITLARKIKLSKEQFFIYKYNKKKFSGFVVQEFLKGLKFDYKILVFWGRFFVLKRNIKEGDFRASGSGLFEFEKPSDELLSYANMIFKKLDVPYASLDIAVTSKGYHLIEFQALNFGPYTLINSPGYYYFLDEKWCFVKTTSSLEQEFSRSLAGFVRDKYLVDRV